ncbi:MAG: hypothetical protein RLZZ292_2823 [Bacteroidota bacterium]|jgi:hypothetical protein
MKSISIYALVACFICSLFSASLLAQVNLTESNLPILNINTNGLTVLNDDKITASMQLIDNGVGKINKITDAPNGYKGKIGIEFRGNTSLDLSDKKPYSIELRDNAGQTQDVALLGMPAESDWVLLAPFSDKSLIRDVLTYKLAGKFMAWSPKSRFVELIFNGQYQGVYAIVEKIKRGKNRVNISKLKPTDQAGDSLTGGYMISFDKYHLNEEPIFLEIKDRKINGQEFLAPIKIVYPKALEITYLQKNYMRNWLLKFENVLTSSNFKDSLDGYRKYIDVPSFIDMMIMQEITRNVDGYRLSAYFHKDKDSKGGKLVAGPVWDFNIALGNANYCEGDKTFGWAFDFNDVCPEDGFGIHFWWKRLMEDEAFTKELANRWKTLRKTSLSSKNLTACIDTMSTELSDAQQRNFQQWSILRKWVWPNSFVGDTYGDEVTFLNQWLSTRAAWIDGKMDEFLEPKYIPSDAFEPFIAPNPSDGRFKMHNYVSKYTDILVQIYDIQGHLLTKYVEKPTLNGKVDIDIDLFAYPTGLYLYQILYNGNLKKTGKLIKQ